MVSIFTERRVLMSTPPSVPLVVRTSVTFSLSGSASSIGINLDQLFQGFQVATGSDGNRQLGTEENRQNRQVQDSFHNEQQQQGAKEHYDLSKFGVEARRAEATFPNVDYFMNVIENHSKDITISEWESKASELYLELDYVVTEADKKLTLRDVISIWLERCEKNQLLKEDAVVILKIALEKVKPRIQQ